jgi:uncharacterized protein (DUF1697 family)
MCFSGASMQRWITFLRAINVGGHNVKMDDLRHIFQNMGFTGVETFIASGNVIFESDSTADLTTAIQTELQARLGYPVATFLRTPAELAAVAAYQAFSSEQMQNAAALNLSFLAEPLDEATCQKLFGLRTEIDNFHTFGREVYWLCRKKQSESTFSNAVLEKTIKRSATMRGMNTIHRMVARYPA